MWARPTSPRTTDPGSEQALQETAPVWTENVIGTLPQLEQLSNAGTHPDSDSDLSKYESKI
jgi:hypothetical protein